MKFYLLRHGTTAWNAARRIQGCTDTTLDEAGKTLARMTGAALAEQGISFLCVFSSPLSRARETAQLAAPGVPVRTDPRLSELRFGSFEGMSVTALQEDESCPFRYFRTEPQRYNEALLRLESERPGEGFESLSALCARADSFRKEVLDPFVLSAPADACVLIAGHGGLNRALMMSFLGNRSLADFWGDGLQANCGIYIIDAEVSAEGSVRYRTDGKDRIFYDPDALPRVPGLL